jgi:hypothetical protein
VARAGRKIRVGDFIYTGAGFFVVLGYHGPSSVTLRLTSGPSRRYFGNNCPEEFPWMVYAGEVIAVMSFAGQVIIGRTIV